MLSSKMDQTVISKIFHSYWVCPRDKGTLQQNLSRRSHNPYFIVMKNSQDISIKNAIAMKKIPPETKEYTKNLVDTIFHLLPFLDSIDLESVYCKRCGSVYSAPKLTQITQIFILQSKNALSDIDPNQKYICTNCSCTNKKSAKFCSYCGQRHCPNCNRAIQRQDKFCKHCGIQL